LDDMHPYEGPRFSAPHPWVSAAGASTSDKEDKVGISVSLFLIAVGAVLAFAVTATVSGVDLVAVGWILMVVGALGLALSIAFWNSWGGFGTTRRETVVTRDREYI
jgi:hypothetical protein